MNVPSVPISLASAWGAWTPGMVASAQLSPKEVISTAPRFHDLSHHLHAEFVRGKTTLPTCP